MSLFKIYNQPHSFYLGHLTWNAMHSFQSCILCRLTSQNLHKLQYGTLNTNKATKPFDSIGLKGGLIPEKVFFICELPDGILFLTIIFNNCCQKLKFDKPSSQMGPKILIWVHVQGLNQLYGPDACTGPNYGSHVEAQVEPNA